MRNPELGGPAPASLVPDWLDNIQRLRNSYMAMCDQMEQQRQSDYFHHHHHHLPGLASLSTTNQGAEENYEDNLPTSSTSNLSGQPQKKSRRGRPRKHAPKIPLPPLYVFIR